MDHDTGLAADAAHDLLARFTGERNRSHAALRAIETQLHRLGDLVIDGTIDYPLALVQQLRARRREVAVLDLVIADLQLLGIDAEESVHVA